MNDLKLDRSIQAMNRAVQAMPGGVNSPVRALRSVGGTPFFAAGGDGAWVVDVDGNRYVDLVLAWGPMILGHRHPAVLRAIRLTVDGARQAGIEVAVCGELGGDPLGAQVLVGLGVAELSMDAARIGAVRLALRGRTLAELQELATRALACGTASEVRALLETG
jgi:glutamate-1-semialdehyde 2,1-aminomutase